MGGKHLLESQGQALLNAAHHGSFRGACVAVSSPSAVRIVLSGRVPAIARTGCWRIVVAAQGLHDRVVAFPWLLRLVSIALEQLHRGGPFRAGCLGIEFGMSFAFLFRTRDWPTSL